MKRTASYSVEFHPDAPHDLDAMLVELEVCDRCGAIVHDDLLHGTWHDQIEGVPVALPDCPCISVGSPKNYCWVAAPNCPHGMPPRWCSRTP